MSKFFQNLLVVLIVSSISRAKLLVNDECSTDRLSCPDNSKCRPLSCRGYRCACGEGYMPADNSTTCIKGAALGQKCGSTYPPCLNANAVCLKGLISLSPPYCQCEKGYINADNLQCLIQTDYKRFGEWCENKCGPTLSCKLGFCQCRPGYRQRTALEIQADPAYKYDCIGNEFSLSKCRGIEVLFLSGINANSLSNGILKTPSERNTNYTDTTPTINQSTYMGTWTSQYNLTSSKADNQSSDLIMSTSIEISTSPTPILLKVLAPSIPRFPTIPTMTTTTTPLAITTTPTTLAMTTTPTTIAMTTTPTTLAMTTAFPSQSSPSNASPNVTNLFTPKSTLTSQSPTKTTKLKAFSTAIPVSHDTTMSHIQKTSTVPTEPQSSVTPPQTVTTQLSLKTQVPTTATNIMTSSVQISQSIPTQSTERVSLSSPTTILVQVPSSSLATIGTTSDPQSQSTMKTPHWSSSSAVTEKPTTLPTIPSQSESSTKNLPTTTNTSTTYDVQTPETTNSTADQNITKTPGNESAVTRTPATQTDAQPRPSSENRISTEAIVIPSVLVIVLAIVITSVIAIVVCRKRRSHLSLSTDSDNSTYKLPRPSMMSQALTSAPSPPSPYNTGSHPSYHYVNEAFENDRL